MQTFYNENIAFVIIKNVFAFIILHFKCFSFIKFSNKYLLSTYFVIGIILRTEDTTKWIKKCFFYTA